MDICKIKFLWLVNFCFYQSTTPSWGLHVIYNITTPNLGQVDFLSPTILDGTTNLKTYGFEVAADYESSIVFEIKACRDSGIYLARSMDGDSTLPLYSIHFDGESDAWSAIRRRTKNSAIFNVFPDNRYHVSDIINCDSFKSMWISWSWGYKQFGTGAVVDQNTLFSWQDPEWLFPIKGVYVYTNFNGGLSGDWKIPVSVSDVPGGRFSSCSLNRKSLLDVLEFSTLSKTECALRCFQNVKCIGFNYNTPESRCDLLTNSGDVLDSIPTTPDASWKFYAKCYSQDNVCVGCFF